MNDTTTEAFTNVWDALADTPQEAANLKVRSELMSQIAALVRERGWTQVEAARRCGVTQPRLNDLLRGRLSRFSLDALVNIAAALGCRVQVGAGRGLTVMVEFERGGTHSLCRSRLPERRGDV